MNQQETYNRELDEQPVAAPQLPAGSASPTRLPDEPYYRQAPPATRPRNRGIGIALVLVGLIWLASMGLNGLFSSGGGNSTLIDQTLPGSRLEMNVGSGDVEIRPWNGQGIHVQAFRRGGSSDYTVEVRTSGDTVQVKGVENNFFCFFCSRDIRYQISVPADLQADIHTSSGDISIEEVSGPVSLGTSSGEVRMRGIDGGATINTTSGGVEIDGIGGQVNITTVSGSVRLADGNNAEAAVRTTSGDVELDGVVNTLNVESVSGEIRVDNARDSQITASTTSGDFTYSGSLAPEGNNRISSVSGNVNLHLPEDSSFQLNASTVSGDLNTEFELRDGQESRGSQTGRAGNGSATLDIETTSGDVSIEH